MPPRPNALSPAARIARWGDRLRDLAANGLRYTDDPYQVDRFREIQAMALEMLALATGAEREELEPLAGSLLARRGPLTLGVAVVLDGDGRVLLQRRRDNGRWALPGGMLDVGETPAAGAVREALEETNVRCEARRLVGVYDSRLWDPDAPQQMLKFAFLCHPSEIGESSEASHAHECTGVAWYPTEALPGPLHAKHERVIADARAVAAGAPAHFDP